MKKVPIYCSKKVANALRFAPTATYCFVLSMAVSAVEGAIGHLFSRKNKLLLGGVSLLFSLLLPVCLHGQSLLEMAQKLDSLYRKIESDPEAPNAFFEELQILYRLDDSIGADKIKRDFATNRFLADEVDYAFFQLSRHDALAVDSIAKLEEEKDSLFTIAIALAEDYCKPRLAVQLEIQFNTSPTDSSGNVRNPVREQAKPCGIEAEIQQLKGEISLQNLGAVWEKSENPELKRLLVEIQQEIYAIENEIKKLDEESESILQLSAGAGGEMPFSTQDVPAATAISPIILQTQGSSGSISSSIIDGTSKWIAERMREELSIAFFDRFEYWVEGQNIRLLFPSTFSALHSSVTTDYSLMIQVFKTAFEKDLKHLPFNLTAFLDSEIAYKDTLAQIDNNILKAIAKINELDRRIEKYDEQLNDLYAGFVNDTSTAASEYTSGYYDKLTKEQMDYYGQRENRFFSATADLNNNLYPLYDEKYAATQELQQNEMLAKEAYKALKYVLFTLKALQILSQGEHPTSLLSHLNQNIDELFPQAGNVKPALLVMDVISRSLVSPDQENNKVWMGMNELHQLKSNRQLREFYFGLVYQEIRQTLRQERSQLELELKEASENEIMYGQFGYEARNRIYQAYDQVNTVVYGYDETSNYVLKTLDSLFASETLDTIISAAAKSELRAALEPIYRKITELDNLNYGAFDKVAKALEEAIARFNATPAIASFLGNNPDTPADTVWKAISPDIYSIPTEVMDSLYGQTYYVPYYYTWMTDLQKDSVAYLSKQLLEKRIKQKTILVKNEDKSPLLAAAHDFMLMNFNWYFVDNQIYHLEDSIVQKVTHAFMVKAKQDSLDIIQEGLENSPLVQRYNLQMRRLDNYQVFIDSLLLGNKRNFGDLVNGFLQFANRMDNINAEFKRLKEEDKANLGTQEFIYLMKNSLEALHKIYEIALPNDPGTLGTIKGLSSNLLDAYAAVLEKDYNAVVMNIIPVADSLLELSYRRKLDELKWLKEYTSDINQKEQDGLIGKILDNQIDISKTPKKDMDKKLKKKLRKIYKETSPNKQPNEWETKLDALLAEKENKVRKMHEIFKYGAFLAAVVQSQNSDEIKNAIRAVALPTGSYSIKRRSFRNISLNAYPGITGGLELASNDLGTEPAPNFGFTAPLGLSFSWGYKSKINGLKYFTQPTYRRRVDNAEQLPGNRFLSGHSGSFFFPLIDLGAVVLFRLDGSNEALPEDINFQQLFSPGIIYAHGLPDLPISILGGVQISPHLRKIGDERANSLRFNLGLVVDLPMANFYTRARCK